MTSRLMRGMLAAFSGIALAAAALGGPVGASFTYQGRLSDASGPVNGKFDFSFKLCSTGTCKDVNVLETIVMNDVVVTEGLFTVNLSYTASNLSGGSQRWLEIVCEGTTLCPRQELTATPFAVFSEYPWQTATTGIYYGGNNFVGVNRSDRVTGSEYFGIQTPTSGTNYGGMYIRTDSDTGRPFYGYNTNTETCWTYLDGSTGSWNVYNSGDRITVTDTGFVGIGVTAPDLRLDVNGRVRVRETSAGSAGIWFHQTTPAADQIFAGMYNDDTFGLYGSNGGAGWEFFFTRSGNVGIGNSSPDVRLQVSNGSDAEPTGGGFIEIGTTTSTNIAIDNNEIMARNNGAVSPIYINFDGGDVYLGTGATTHVSVLEITGADVAEKFPVSAPVEPGYVVQIDPANAGQLCLSTGAYNRRVAGIVSGAGDIPVGAILGNLPGKADAPPIALSGRVYCWCDASNGAIELGDMLTTSDTPGHAMKATDGTRSHGAVLGKAMTELKEGKGLVLVLVNLQ